MHNLSDQAVQSVHSAMPGQAVRQGFLAAAGSGALALLIGAPVFVLTAAQDWEGRLYLGIAVLTIALCPIPSSILYLLAIGGGGALAGRLLARRSAAVPEQILRQVRWTGAAIGGLFGILPFVLFWILR